VDFFENGEVIHMDMISRRDALRKFGLLGVAVLMPTLAAVGEAEASRRHRRRKPKKRRVSKHKSHGKPHHRRPRKH
jgi:hypothetical protein